MDGLFGSQGESHQTQPPFESSYPSCIIVCMCIKFEVDMDYHLQVFSILRQCIYVLKQIDVLTDGHQKYITQSCS